MKLTAIQVANGPKVKVDKIRYRRFFKLRNDNSNVFGTVNNDFVLQKQSLINYGSTIKELSFVYFGILSFCYLGDIQAEYFDILIPFKFIDKLKLYNDSGELIDIQSLVKLLNLTMIDKHSINDFFSDNTYSCCRGISTKIDDSDFIDIDIKLDNYTIKADIKSLFENQLIINQGLFDSFGLSTSEKILVLRFINKKIGFASIYRALLCLIIICIDKCISPITNKLKEIKNNRFCNNKFNPMLFNSGIGNNVFNRRGMRKLNKASAINSSKIKLYNKARKAREEGWGM